MTDTPPQNLRATHFMRCKADQATERLLRYGRHREQWLSRNRPDAFFILHGEIADLRVVAIHNDDVPPCQIIGPTALAIAIAFSCCSFWVLLLPLTAGGISSRRDDAILATPAPAACLASEQHAAAR